MYEIKEYKIDWGKNICCVLRAPDYYSREEISGILKELKTKPPIIALKGDIDVRFIDKNEFLSENEFLKKLNEKCLKLGTKTNFLTINHLADYIISAEGLIAPWRDQTYE